jgi:calcineurin-like phosphoesterase family protein
MPPKSNPPKQFYWSDPHIGHAAVLRYDNRPFNDIYEMNEALIQNYNSVVGPNDRCIWVGDCFLTAKVVARDVMDRLNGIKICVAGNHDHRPTQMLGLGFAFSCYEMTIKIAGRKVLVSHYPYADESDTRHETKYADYRPKDNGLWLLHGHVHNKWGKFRKKMINVGACLWDYTPISHSYLEVLIQQNPDGFKTCSSE